MIFVTLGTQDKDFSRLLKAIDEEIDKGHITDKVIVQAGYTKYKSKNMEIFDLVNKDDFDNYMKKANLVITHGGVGSILTAIKNDKKVIAAARLSKYGEHTNDHQLQIINEFSKLGYILALDDFDKMNSVIKKSKNFKPKKFVSNNKKFVNMISNYIDDSNNISWFNKYKYFILILIIILLLILIFI